jgi:hypothetical protein
VTGRFLERVGIPCLAAAMVLGGCTGARRPVDLRLRLAQGQEMRFTQSTSQAIRHSADGRIFELEQELRAELKLRVRERSPDGRHIVDASYEALDLTIRSAGHTLAWDSRAPGQGAAALRPLAALVGEEFTIVVSDRGVVEKVLGLDLLEKRLGERMAGRVVGQDGPDGGGFALPGGWLASGSAATDLASLFCPFPAGPVAVGDLWETERRGTGTPDPAGLGLRLRDRWVLRSRSGARATIGLGSVLDAPPAGGTQARGAGISGTRQGTLVVDIPTGRLVSSSLEQVAGGTVLLQGVPVTVEIRARVQARSE